MGFKDEVLFIQTFIVVSYTEHVPKVMRFISETPCILYKVNSITEYYIAS
jgi:hypothetical protein